MSFPKCQGPWDEWLSVSEVGGVKAGPQPTPTFTCPKVVYRNTGISATVMASACIMDMPSVLRNAMAGPAPSGLRAAKENVFNWPLAGSQAPSTPQKDRDAHTRGSFHRAGRQTTKSDTRICSCEHSEKPIRVPWGVRWEQSLPSEHQAWNQAPALWNHQQEGSQMELLGPTHPLPTLSPRSRRQHLWYVGPRTGPRPGRWTAHPPTWGLTTHLHKLFKTRGPLAIRKAQATKGSGP